MTMSISLSAVSQYALCLLERSDAPALRKNGRHLGHTTLSYLPRARVSAWAAPVGTAPAASPPVGCTAAVVLLFITFPACAVSCFFFFFWVATPFRRHGGEKGERAGPRSPPSPPPQPSRRARRPRASPPARSAPRQRRAASRARRPRVAHDARRRRAAHAAQRATACIDGGAAARPRVPPRAAARWRKRGCRPRGRPRAARPPTRVSGRHRPVGVRTRCRAVRRGDRQRRIAPWAARRPPRWHGQRWSAAHIGHAVKPPYERRERPPRTGTPPDVARRLRMHRTMSLHPTPARCLHRMSPSIPLSQPPG